MVKKNVVLGVILTFIVVLQGCTKPRLESHWMESDAAFDGKDEKWEKAIAYTSDEFAVSLANDRDNLYVFLSSDSPMVIGQVLGLFKQELIFWFDPLGKGRKVFGVSVTYRRQDSDLSPGMRQGGMDSVLEESVRLAKILLPDKEGYSKPLMLDDEVKIAEKISRGHLVYGMKIPLKATGQNVYAIGAEPGTTISMGVETSEIDPKVLETMKASREKRMKERGGPGGGPGGGMGGPGGGMGGPGGGMGGPGGGMGGPGGGGGHGGGRGGMKGPGGSGGNSEPDRLEFWATVKLAENTAKK